MKKTKPSQKVAATEDPHVQWTITRLQACKSTRKIACLTAYDHITARLLDQAGIPLILVGDSLAMTMQGHRTTLPVNMDAMLYHTAAVSRGVRQSLVVADMPFLSYQVSDTEAIRNAGRLLQESGADAVKIEGGAFRATLIRNLTRNGIPVLGHIGLTPQSIRLTGAYKVQGRRARDSNALLRDAQALEESGVFAMVLECLPAALGRRITRAVKVPTIGIGAGPGCDGQILVTHDMLGIFEDFRPRFVKAYADLAQRMRTAFTDYRREVEGGAFPDSAHCY
ncbi:MAG: 3-methyl-2-oxobutanoate hydroxymethyltransferase [Kiritimatiellia bacterium]|nr:3-methyl-2-oxobutanoate hydroxymethyltransferase [Lentisphaerota bacterium]